jgi:hypothetical protein
MSDHDPLCSPDSLYPGDAEDEFCHCELVALVRADEREKGYEGTSAKDWARLAREANAACIGVMDERDAAKRQAMIVDAMNVKLLPTCIHINIESECIVCYRERIAQEIEATMLHGHDTALEAYQQCARIARGGIQA